MTQSQMKVRKLFNGSCMPLHLSSCCCTAFCQLHQALHRYCFIPSAFSCHCISLSLSFRQTCCCYCIIPATVVALVSVIDRTASSTVCRMGNSHNYQRCCLLDECISCNADCLIILLLAMSALSLSSAALFATDAAHMQHASSCYCCVHCITGTVAVVVAQVLAETW